jgi:thiol:disulfide interchange protein
LALTMPTAQGLAIFAALGLGMALPYLLVSAVPSLARALPRPGPWMEVFRRAMAFPVLATVVWLLWVLGQQSGINGAAALLLLLLALAALLWSWGLVGRSRWVLGGASGLLMLALLLGLGPQVIKPLAPDGAAAQTDTEALAGDAARAAPGLWRPWSAEAVAQELQAGRRVFVDFTAAWCVTCQVNKQTTLSNPALLEELAQGSVSLMRADWTRRDPAISAALAQLGRSGVPVYALYAPGQAPVLLSELISVADVRAAVERTR